MNKRFPLIFGSLVILIGMIVLVSFAASATGTKSLVIADSGVKACEAMANKMANPNQPKAPKMNAARYAEAKKPFENSRHADLRVAGTNLLSTIYSADKLSQKPDDLGAQFGEAMVLMSAVQTNWSALQVACGNHGVTVPPLPTV